MRKRLRQHNLFGNDTHKSDAGNISGIIDRILRVTTKVTSHYAGDVLYEIDALNDHIKQFPTLDYHKLLGFREMGVTTFDIVKDTSTNECFAVIPDGSTIESELIQCWTLSYIPAENQAFTNDGQVVFERVDITR